MPMVFIQTLEDFSAKHGTPLHYGGRLWYRTGASATPDGHIFCDPPTSRFKRVRLKIDYWQTALERAEKDFDDAQSGFMEQARLGASYTNLPGMQHDAEQILQRLKAVAEDCKRQIAFLTRVLEKTPEMQAFREEEQRRIKMKSQMHLAVGRIAAIKLED